MLRQVRMQLLTGCRCSTTTQEEAENTGEVARVQEELCSKFTEWSRTGQLRVGYLLYLDHRIQAGDYLTKVAIQNT